jgi:selenide,water dikinase
MTRLVLLGGGHAHAIVLRKFRDFVSKNLDVTLVSESPMHTYSGMVPGVVAGHYNAKDAQIDLERLARRAGAAFLQARVEQVSAGTKQVVLAGGLLLRYDVLSLNLGSMPAGASPVKPFDRFLARWRELRSQGPVRVAVVGAGAGGAELAMAMKHALGQAGGGTVEVFAERFPFEGRLAQRVRNALERRGIPLRIGEAPGEGYAEVFHATGPSAPAFLRESGLACDAQGFVRVDASLRSVSHRDVFAAGDCASLEGAALPKSGVYAVRQGPVLAENLKRAVRGMALQDYEPQAAALSIFSCGNQYAIASRGGWSAEGGWVWRWKDWLDRRWVGRFR